MSVASALILLVMLSAWPAAAQTPVDLASLGPQPGAAVPGFSAPDQQGRTQTLQTVLGPNGALLVFSRSADW